jgi:hypothetical protein
MHKASYSYLDSLNFTNRLQGDSFNIQNYVKNVRMHRPF